MMEEPPGAPTLVLVTGAGRSGTSTIAGTLSRLGFVIPQPEVPADETNPRGFYEPQWVVDFHKRVLDQLPVRTNDARPEAVDKAAAMTERPDLRAELAAWLKEWANEPRVVIKDPRAFWLHGLWRLAAAEVGLDLAFLTMLRHPAAVARSRDTHYLSEREADFRRARETTNVASWCHGILVTERASRGDRRSFVLYSELMEQWRTAMRRADAQLGTGATSVLTEEPHPVDDFIDVKLNRSEVNWDEMLVHPEVRELAEAIWESVHVLVESPADPATYARLDELHTEYNRLYTFARDLTLDQTMVELAEHRRVQREQRQKLRRRIDRLRKENAALKRRVAKTEASRAFRLVRRIRGR